MSYSAPLIANRHAHTISTRLSPLSRIFTQPTATAVYPTSDLAIYVPVLVYETVVVRKLFCLNGSVVSGNIDVGVYSQGGTRVVSAGTTAQAGVSGPQIFDVTDTVVRPGCYFVAVVLDNITGQITRDNDAAPICTAWGVLTQQLGAGAALPATATFALSQTLAYLPYIGMLVEATVA